MGSTCQAPWSSTSIKSPPSPTGPENESSSSSSTATLVQHPHSSSHRTQPFLPATSLHATTSASSASIGDPVSRPEDQSGQATRRASEQREEGKKTSPEKRTESGTAGGGASKSLRSRRRRRSLSLCESFSDGESPDGEFCHQCLLCMCLPVSKPKSRVT